MPAKKKRVSKAEHTFLSIESSYSSPEFKQNYLAGKRFYCVICDHEWTHQAGSNWRCPQCKSHLYAREIAE